MGRSKLCAWIGLDLRSLALFRIALGALLLVDLLLRFPHIEANYTDAGIHPRDVFERVIAYPSLHALGGSSGYQVALFSLALGFAVMLLVGFRTRLATFASWVLLLSLHNRSIYLTDGGDVFVSKLLMWSIFLPLGARASLDARRSKTPVAEPGTCVLSPAAFALIAEFVYMFASAGAVKTSPEWRSTGTALQLVFGQSYWGGPLGEYLAQFPDLLRPMTTLVLYFESFAPFLLLVPVFVGPLRCLTILAFWGFLGGLGLGVQLHFFPCYSSAALLALIPTWFWHKLKKGPARALPLPRSSTGPAWARRLGTGVSLLLLALFGSHVVASETKMPEPIGEVTGAIRITHRWTMYATPPTRDFRFDVVGYTRAGRAVPLLDAPAEGPWADVLALRGTYRFKYFRQKTSGKPDWVQEPYLAWLGRKWNEGQSGPDRIHVVRSFVEVWDILPESEPVRSLLALHTCPASDE